VPTFNEVRELLGAIACKDEIKIKFCIEEIEKLLTQVELKKNSSFEEKVESTILEIGNAVLPVLVKSCTDDEAEREQLAYRLSKQLGFYCVPPTAKKASTIIQLSFAEFTDEPAYYQTGDPVDLPPALKVFRYIVNLSPDDPACMLGTTSQGSEQPIIVSLHHGRAFSAEAFARGDSQIAAIKMGEVFTQKKWENFLCTSDDFWQKHLAFLNEEERKGFIQRINNVKQQALKQIENNNSSLLPRLSLKDKGGQSLSKMLDGYEITLDNKETDLPVSVVAELIAVHGNFKLLPPELLRESHKFSQVSNQPSQPLRGGAPKLLSRLIPCVGARAQERIYQPARLSCAARLSKYSTKEKNKKDSEFVPTRNKLIQILNEHGIKHRVASLDLFLSASGVRGGRR
jgi:hypothetical protein